MEKTALIRRIIQNTGWNGNFSPFTPSSMSSRAKHLTMQKMAPMQLTNSDANDGRDVYRPSHLARFSSSASLSSSSRVFFVPLRWYRSKGDSGGAFRS